MYNAKKKALNEGDGYPMASVMGISGPIYLTVMAHLHCWIQTWIWTPNPMAILHYAEVFTLHGVRFRFQS